MVNKEPKLQYVKCDLCGQDKTHSVYVERGFNIVECIYCGLVYVNPRFSYDHYRSKTNLSYEELVSESLNAADHQQKNSSTNDLNRNRYIRERTKESLSNLKQLKNFGKKSGRLLDVGCGEGFFLKAATREGWEAIGIEISSSHKPPTEDCLYVIQEDILKVDLEENSFDAITFYDVLEHLPYPDEALKKSWTLLKKDGILVIRVPNEKFLRLKMKIISTFFNNDFVLKKINFSILGYYAPETHLYNFNQETLKKLLKNNEFKIHGIHLGKFALGAGTIRWMIHYFVYHLTKMIYFISRGNVNYNCSITVFAKK